MALVLDTADAATLAAIDPDFSTALTSGVSNGSTLVVQALASYASLDPATKTLIRATYLAVAAALVKNTTGGGGSAAETRTPYFIASGNTFTVPEFVQQLSSMALDCEGFLSVEGFWVEV